MSLISPLVQIVVMDANGQIRTSQRYSDYLNTPSPSINAAAYGRTLLDLLTQEAYIDANLQLKQIFTDNNQADATRLIGNLAEALVVEYCRKHPEVNRTLATYARFGERATKSLDNFLAIGTGSKATEMNYRQHYQPRDTQRDIVWIDKTDNSKLLACVGGTASSSTTAGLQVKASQDGINYVLPSISDYYYPILYFDLSDDWGIVEQAAKAKNPNATLIHPDEIMREIKEHLKGYYKLVLALIQKKMTIKDIIDKSMYEGDSPLIAGIAASDVNIDKTIIISA
jgi:hypothetical protein